MKNRPYHNEENVPQRDWPGVILGTGFLLFGLSVLALIPYQVSLDPIPGAAQYVSFTPAALPKLCAVAMALLGALQLLLAMRSRPRQINSEDEGADEPEVRVHDLLLLAVALVAYPIVIVHVGYLIATFGFLLLLMIFGGERNARILLACSIGVPIAVYALFVRLMAIPLPSGSIFN